MIHKTGIIYASGDEIGENLMPNAQTMELGTANASIGRWRTAGSNTMTRARVLIANSPIGTCYGFQNVGTQTAADASCFGIDNFPTDANETYTISMWARCEKGNTDAFAGFAIYSITYGSGSHETVINNYRVTRLPTTGEWTRCWLTFTTNANTTRNIYIGITTGETSVTTQMCGIKIEKGTVATPWTMNENDWGFVGNDHGFIEKFNGEHPMSVYEGHYEMDEIIEY